MTSGLRLYALGVGDAFSRRHYSSCLALEADGSWLLVDCPHPIRKILYEAGEASGVALDLDRFVAVAITHLHADHSSGLEGLGFYHSFHLGRRARLLAHPDVSARLWEGHLAAGMEWQMPAPSGPRTRAGIGDYFELMALAEERDLCIGPFSLRCRRTIHSVPTTALLIRAGDRCLGYSADTAFDPKLISWLDQADLIVHETNRGIHTPYEALAGLPAPLRAKMRLIHYPDDFEAGASVIEPLYQGRCYSLS